MLVSRKHGEVCLVLALVLGFVACSQDNAPGADSSGDDGDGDESSDDRSEDEAPVEAADAGKKRDAGKEDAGKRSQDQDAASAANGKDASSAAKRDAGTGSAPKGPSVPDSPSMVPAPAFVSGPLDGDPSSPVVSIPDVACGGSAGLDGFVGNNFGGFPVPGTPNLQIGGRDVILTYPCNKHEGAHITFILNLHGTMPDESLKLYEHSYFAAHKLSDSHNLIIAEPKSVVSQWGNGDDGKDLPHLYDVINWVYDKFSKFNITGLWVAGHSWGAMFAKSFVCDDMLKERARGVIGMSGGATGVGGGIGGLFGGTGSNDCSDRVSQIHTVGDQEAMGGVPGLPDQTAAATRHGCGAKMGPMDIGNMQMLDEWPNCSPGWTHFDFTMGAHEHTTPINDEVVKYIVEQIKATETMTP
ncbi:MAG TPA: alpha/beta hydrolase [Polyangiaceae bacterium]|nr:alpha/beta hydrolase [Polyangiaceae bacterium]